MPYRGKLQISDWDVDEFTLYKEARDPYEYEAPNPSRRDFYPTGMTFYQVKTSWSGAARGHTSPSSVLFRSDAEIADLFKSLTRQWREATAGESNLERVILNPAYQRIIGLGPQVVSLILKDLEETRGHWFWALMAIVGEDKAAGQRSVGAAAEAWLAWGRSIGAFE